ncbi:hypothetical protein GC197_00950 [bacterium]|nr:hypothetical protein [bacterium]
MRSHHRTFLTLLLLLIAPLPAVWSQDQGTGQAKEEEQPAPEAAEHGAKKEGAKLTSPHKNYFDSFDTNGDGVIVGEEWLRLPRSMRSHLESRGQQKVGTTLADFHDFLERYKTYMIEERKRNASERELAEVQRKNDWEFSKYVTTLIPEELQTKNEKPWEETSKSATMKTSPYADFFRHLDQNGNGTLDQAELKNTSQLFLVSISRDYPDQFHENRISIQEFHDYWEREKQRYQEQKEQSREQHRFEDFKLAVLRGELAANDATKKPAETTEQPKLVDSAPKKPVNKPVVMAKPPTPKAPLRSLALDIVALRRTSEGTPQRTLAEDVAGVLKGSGLALPLPTRLAAWIADPESGDVEMTDYIQTNVVPGEKATIQQGGRMPTRTGVSGRSAVFSVSNVGTLVNVLAKIESADQVELQLTFEKSYVLPGNLEESPADLTPMPSESRPERLDPANPQARRPFSRPNPVPSPVEFTPDSIGTLTAQSAAQLKRGEPIVITEIGRLQGDEFEELVILVQWK